MMQAIAGGALIGTGAALLWLLNGQIAGVCGIARGTMFARGDERVWRALFLLGLVAGGALMTRLMPGSVGPSPVGTAGTLIAGLLVGVGTTLGNGCTSGHGVCGVSRLSPRSLVATALFVATGMVIASFARHVGVL